MRLAILADIHGNADAPEAVLAEIDGQAFDHILCLGDHFSGPLEAGRVAERLIGRADIKCLAGNHDRYLLQMAPDAMGPSDRAALQHLEGRHLDWLRGLPATLDLGEIFACHGTPASDEAYWLETVVGERLQLADRPQVEQAAAQLPADCAATLLLCAHSHVPRLVRLASGAQVVNPGSVGCPGYTDDHPAHVMKVGSPDARYAVAERMSAGWRVCHHAIPYDNDRAVALARAAGDVRSANFRPSCVQRSRHRSQPANR